MAGLKNFLKRFSAAQIIFSLIAVISLILYLILTLWWRGQEKKLTDQQAADRWGGREYAQVSCFVTRDVTLDDFSIRNFENQLTTALADVAVTLDEEEGSVQGNQQKDCLLMPTVHRERSHWSVNRQHWKQMRSA